MIAAALLAGKFPQHARGCPSAALIRQQEGCDGPRELPWILNGRKYHRCPMHYIDAEMFLVLEAYSAFKAGIPPNSGGLMDQPASFLDAVRILDSELADYAEERAREQRRKKH